MTRGFWQRDPQAQVAVQALWASDPDPGRTLATQVEIDLAIARGDVAIATWQGYALGRFATCPWAPIYEARHPATIAGRRLAPLQHFTFDVSAEGFAWGQPFRRQILVGPFYPNPDSPRG